MTVVSPELVAGLAADAEAAGIAKFVAAAVIEHDGRVLLLRRKPEDFMGGLWEIPSGKVEAGETLLEALRRETAEETGLTISTVHGYSDISTTPTAAVASPGSSTSPLPCRRPSPSS